MRKLLLLSFIVVLSAAFALAQSSTQSSTDSNATQSTTATTQTTSSSDANPTSVQGCLSGSDGNYTLTDKTGKVFQLSGNTTGLQAHVGHSIQVTGTSPSTTSASASATSTGNQPSSMSSSTQSTFNVSSFKHLDTTCDSSK